MIRASFVSLSFAVLLSACLVGGAPPDPSGSGDGSDFPPPGGGGSGSGSGSGDPGPGPAHRLRIAGNKIIDDQGKPVRLSGVNWFGLETETFAPHGLWQVSMDSMLDNIVSLGFNTLRIPYSNQMFDAASIPNGFDTALNPDLVGKTAEQILDILIQKAGAKGLRVILDRHRPDSLAQSNLWYTPAYSEARWIADWEKLAVKYKDNPVVVAFDLHNEPHAEATWGDGNLATDWRLAAQRAGNAILAKHPDILIIVEGVEIHGGNYYWWGGNLRGVANAPVQLNLPDRVIYSPHEYPSSLYAQPWFADPTYPANLPGVWDATWGNVAATAPVLIGEFGTKLETTSDQQWLTKLVQYIQAKDLSFTYWSINPNSTDTGGILQDNWVSPHQAKVLAILPILAPLLPVP